MENVIALLKILRQTSGLNSISPKQKLRGWDFGDSMILKWFGLGWTKDPAVPWVFSFHLMINYNKNIIGKMNKFDNRLNFRKSRNLTLLGKSLILKCLRIPELIYSASLSSVPKKSNVKLITSQVFNFLWNEKPDKIKRQVLYQDHSEEWSSCTKYPNQIQVFKSCMDS